MPTPKQMEKFAADAARREANAIPSAALGPGDAMPEEYWDAVLRGPQPHQRSGVPIQHRRLSEIPRHILRVSCRRCDRIVEIQTADAVRLYGAQAVWKDAGRRLLDNDCQNRTGSHEDDGCWANFELR